MDHRLLKLTFALVPLSLGACSGPSETFDCPVGKGVGCQSISTVNQMVDNQVIGQELLGDFPPIDKSQPPTLGPLALGNFSSGNPEGLQVRRIPEQHLRVWIAPFQDTHGNFYEGGIVHTILSPGGWEVGYPADLEEDSPPASDPIEEAQTSLEKSSQPTKPRKGS